MKRKHRNSPYTIEECQAALDAYEKKGSHRKAAKHLGLTLRTFGRRLDRAITLGLEINEHPNSKSLIEEETSGDAKVVSAKGIRCLEDLLDVANIDRTEWIVTKKIVNKWDALGKEGAVPLFQIKAWLERRPEWYVKQISPIKPLKRLDVSTESAMGTALIIPDSQHGFRRQLDGSLHPIHDRIACDIALQTAKILQPEYIVLMGDMLDLAPWSTKYAAEPSLKYTTQPALVELHWWLASFRKFCPEAKILYLEGNHEYRILKALIEKADEIVDLRPANDLGGEPLLSVNRLLALDDLDIEYYGPYGASYWLWDTIRLHHGKLVRARGGQTVSAMLSDATHSQIVGHIHRREYASKTITTSSGQKTISAMSPGCLCRIDGAVPHNVGSPLNWQQGLGLVHKHNDHISMQILPIEKGKLVFRGQVIKGKNRISSLRKASNLPFV